MRRLITFTIVSVLALAGNAAATGRITYGRGLRRITNGKREFWFSGDYSPDGSRIAITHVPQSLDRIEIVDMAADASDQHVVATCLDPFGCNHPNWWER